MFNKLYLFISIVIIFTGCRSVPETLSTNRSNVPEWFNDFPPDDEIWGIGFDMDKTKQEMRANIAVSRQLSTKYKYTSVNWYCKYNDKRYDSEIGYSVSSAYSTFSSWLKEFNIKQTKSITEGEFYLVGYKKPDDDALRYYPNPISPVTSLFTLEEAVVSAAGNVSNRLSSGSKIAIINISARVAVIKPFDDGATKSLKILDNKLAESDAEYVIEELSTLLVKISKEENKGYTMVDRRSLDAIRREQNFQMSGEVSDDTIVSIGQFLGADVVITGSITGTNEFRRLRVKALDVKTARLLIQTNLKY